MPVENNSRNRILERTRDSLKTKCPHKGCAKAMFIYEFVEHDKECEHKVRHDRLWLDCPYVGQWRNGKPHGQGKYTDTLRNVYEGEWKDGLIHGRGKMTFHGGDVYEGEWKAGVPHGQGKVTYTNENGDVYEGKWKDGEVSEGTISFCGKRSSAPLQTTLDRPNTAKRQRT